MGLLNKLIGALGLKKKEARILILGLNNSGKSTLLNQLKNEDGKCNRDVVPTVGFNVEKFKSECKILSMFTFNILAQVCICLRVQIYLGRTF